MILQIRQILDRAKQGQTRPFLCVAEDGQTYFVKGRHAGLTSLVAEWIAGQLARNLSLPVPVFRLVEVSAEALELAVLAEKEELAAGVWFGSRRVDLAGNLAWAQAGQVAHELRARVLLFDRWVANGDCNLTAQGGNVNLLWTPANRCLHAIDHNLAFDPSDLDASMQTHVFREAAALWTADFRAGQSVLMRAAAGRLDEFWAQMPAEWTGVPHPLTRASLHDLLWRFERDPASFWHLP